MNTKYLVVSVDCDSMFEQHELCSDFSEAHELARKFEGVSTQSVSIRRISCDEFGNQISEDVVHEWHNGDSQTESLHFAIETTHAKTRTPRPGDEWSPAQSLGEIITEGLGRDRSSE